MVKPLHQWSDVYIALGSNLNEPSKMIDAAIVALHNTDGIKVLKTAPYFENPPVGFQSSNMFVNTVVLCKSHWHPEYLLQQLQNIERDMGRVYAASGYADRCIDLDIIAYQNMLYKSQKLEIPHPRMTDRAFVLKPLAEINPEWMHPKLQKTAAHLLKMVLEKARRP